MNYKIARQIADHSGAPADSPLYNQIGGTASDLAAAEQTIRRGITDIRSALTGIEAQLSRTDGPPRLNDLGELQRQGPDLDAAVIKFTMLQAKLAGLTALAADLYPQA